jgi:hypothetical protein
MQEGLLNGSLMRDICNHCRKMVMVNSLLISKLSADGMHSGLGEIIKSLNGITDISQQSFGTYEVKYCCRPIHEQSKSEGKQLVVIWSVSQEMAKLKHSLRLARLKAGPLNNQKNPQKRRGRLNKSEFLSGGGRMSLSCIQHRLAFNKPSQNS